MKRTINGEFNDPHATTDLRGIDPLEYRLIMSGLTGRLRVNEYLLVDKDEAIAEFFNQFQFRLTEMEQMSNIDARQKHQAPLVRKFMERENEVIRKILDDNKIPYLSKVIDNEVESGVKTVNKKPTKKKS